MKTNFIKNKKNKNKTRRQTKHQDQTGEITKTKVTKHEKES